MDQEKIDWTLDVISRLKEAEMGDGKKLDEINYQLENKIQVSDKDSKYLKKHYKILDERESKERAKVCARCKKKLGFMKYSPGKHCEFTEKICGDCFTLTNSSHHRSFEGKYIEGTLKLKEGSRIDFHLNGFGGGAFVIIAKEDKFVFPLENLITYHQVEIEKNSMTKKIITAGLKDTTKSDMLELKFEDNSIVEQKIVLKIKKLGEVMEQIHKLKTLMEEGENQKNTEEIEGENQKTEQELRGEFGTVIKETPSGQYYGGHNAYLAGGTFGDAQNGVLTLTEKYLIFNKNAMRESKRWQIVIPLDKVIVGDWKIDEKIRRKSMAGGGIGFGLFGGAGTIHDTGKSHDIVVPYVDENGMDQAPRFGVSSITGNAIREWAKLIYDALVKIQKEKPSETPKADADETKTLDEDPLKVLKLRLVKGEITKEEFSELKELLE